MSSSAEIKRTLSSGTRSRGRLVQVSLDIDQSGDAERRGPRAALAVGRSVGGAVERNRVSRRIRHCLRDPLTALPAGSRVVVRAFPASARASSRDLADELSALLAAALRKRSCPGSSLA